MSKDTTQSKIPLASHRDTETDSNPYLSIDSEEQQQQEQSEEESNDQTVDLLSKRFKQFNKNAPRSKEQFYESSFKIFSDLNDCIKGNDSSELKDSKRIDIAHIVTDYVDLIHDYEDTSKRTSIWDMAYLLYFSTEDSSLVTRLNGWLHENMHLTEHIDDLEYNEDEEDFFWIWENTQRNLLRGNFIEAIEALNAGIHTLDESEVYAVKKIIRFIEKFQDIQDDQVNPSLYASKWIALHEECISELDKFMESHIIDREPEDIDEEIRLTYSILTGDENSIFASGQYYERVIGSLLFSRPSTTTTGLYHIAQRAVANDTEIDVCAYLLMGCFDDAFEACNDLWLQTHLGHALIAVDAKSSDITTMNKNLTDQEAVIDPIYYCIEQYANMIAEENNMWKEAVIYLSACAENREIWIKRLLNETSLKSKDMDLLTNVLDIAIKEKMTRVQKYIHRVIGKRYEHSKDIKKATIEYGKAEDLESLDRFAHVEFSHYLKTGKLENVVTDMEQLKSSPHYEILILYHNFKLHLGKKEWNQASKILLQLLQHEHLPTKFETVLLVDNLAILDDSKQHYNQKEMLLFIKLFKEISKDISNEDFLAKYYKLIHHKELPAAIASAKLREKIAYKAAIATAGQ